MNRSESKYFATAEKMDEAFMALLEKKDLAYITVKEICAAANVNRSTFYLHYETIGDLLAECTERMNRHFLEHMDKDSAAFVSQLGERPQGELFLITPEYLVPYLSYIKQNRRLFQTAVRNAGALDLGRTYDRMFHHVFTPILVRYDVPEQDRPYLMSFFMRGLMAIVAEWLEGDCADSVEHIASLMQRCIPEPSI